MKETYTCHLCHQIASSQIDGYTCNNCGLDIYTFKDSWIIDMVTIAKPGLQIRAIYRKDLNGYSYTINLNNQLINIGIQSNSDLFKVKELFDKYIKLMVFI